MPHLMKMIDGKIEPILDKEDFAELVMEYMGEEAYDFYCNLLKEIDQWESEKEELIEEIESLEAELEDLTGRDAL